MRREQSGKCNNGVEGLPVLGSPRTLARASAPIWVGTGAGVDAAALGCSGDNDPRMVLEGLDAIGALGCSPICDPCSTFAGSFSGVLGR